MGSIYGVRPVQNSSDWEQPAQEARGPEFWLSEGAGERAAKGSRVIRTLVGTEDFTFSDLRILLMAHADLLIFLLSFHSCLKSAAERVLTAFR